MPELVWIRDYAEKVGCKVTWDAEHGWVYLDDRFLIIPNKVSEGKAYAYKDVVDFGLRHLGYDVPEEIPSTSRATEEIREKEEYEQRMEQLASRSIPSWTDIKNYLRGHFYEPLRDWVVDHIWRPVVDWVQGTYNSIRSIIPNMHELYKNIASFLAKVRQAIVDKFLQAIDTVSEWYGYTVNWIKFNLDRLEYLVSDEILTAIFHLRFYLKKFIWLVDDAFDRVFAIVEHTADVVADYIVRTFYKWVDSVGSLLEDYIVEHWDD